MLVVSLVAFGALVLTGPSASAASGWKGDTSPTMNDLIPTLAGGEAYTERYSFHSGMEGGGSVSFDFTISNLGWGDAQAGVEVRVKFPDRDNYTFKKNLKRSEWSYDKKSFQLKMGETSVRATGDNSFKLRHDGKMRVEMQVSSKTPMWSPGELKQGDRFFRLDFYALKAKMEGRLRYDGSWHDISGDKSGYGEHAATNIAPYNMAKRFSKSRVYSADNDIFFIWREIKLTSDYGGHSVSFILVGYKDEIILTDNKPTVKFGKVKTDKETGYRLPRAIQVEGSQKDNSVKLVMRGKDMKRKDLLKRYGKVAQMVASSMTQPYNYYFDMEWGLSMDIEGSKASVRGDGGYTIDWVNK
jgi:hypothetical protein